MSKTAYNISLKGYVGGYDFDRATVDRELAKNEGKQVNVLIDSLGGSLATGLSISAAFKNHGNVNVHFVGLNASAATIASLGAAHISIDAGAMYLVHQCSMALFSVLRSAFGDNEWGSLNSAQFATLIADCKKIKADLDKLDLNCAQLYAARCKRKPEDLLALMKVGGWLTAKEALDWGFVDEITDLADEPAPKLTDALASAMANAGMPIPNIPLAENDRESLFGKFLTAIASLFKPSTNPISSAMIKTYTFLSAILADKPLTVKDGSATISAEQLDAVENHIAGLSKKIEDRDKAIADRDKTIADLQAKLAKTPAEPSKQVVEDNKPGGEPAPKNDVEQFVDTYNSARALYNEV